MTSASPTTSVADTRLAMANSPDDVRVASSSQRPYPVKRRWFEVRGTLSTGHTLFLGVVGAVAFVSLWHWQSTHSANVILASPLDVLRALWRLLTVQNFASDIWVSTLRILGSFAIACAIAVPLGILMGTFARVAALFNPVIATWRYLPAPAFVPLLLMW